MIIAIDGPAASGKGTLARRLAAHFGYHHLDTGLLYRGVAASLLDAGVPLTDSSAAEEAARLLEADRLDAERLRTAALSEAASVVAAYPAVRQALLELQRQFARRLPGAVLDGRDIGSVVCPEASRKLFITATAEERARRRALELQGRGEAVRYETVLADIRRRDERDSGRAAAPLVKADDAILLDTTNLDIEAALRAAIETIERGTLSPRG